ncbi:MAG: hypothetical protein DI604_20190 [Delftia acidovorans]|nr:MAG: hypothetical protein DI604_20190 [Delftia acidovorans]
MQIENLSNPGVAPVDGDLVRITYEGGTVETKQYFPPPPFAPPIEPEPPTATPILYAAAQLAIVDYDITGIEINSRFGGAFWADVGKYIVFFSEPLPDASYMVMASAGPLNAYVIPADKSPDMFTITVTNSAGQPADAEAVNISIVRAL